MYKLIKNLLPTILMVGSVSSMEIYNLSTSNTSLNLKLISVLKTNAREDFINKFQYASDELLKTFTEQKKATNFINLKKLKLILEEKIEFLKRDNLKKMNSSPFSSVQVPIKFHAKSKHTDLNLKKQIACNKTYKLITNKQNTLEKSFWHISIENYTNYPTLVFVPLIGATPTNINSEEDLTLFMTGISFDLQTVPRVRGIDVPENVKLLFDYFIRYNYCNDNPTQKVFACSKYLSKNQMQTMVSQLLSVYIREPSYNNCNEWATLLAMYSMFNADEKCLSKLINNEVYKPSDIFYRFMRQQIALPSQWNTQVKNFTKEVLKRFVRINPSTTNLIFEHVCFQKLMKYHVTPILKKLEAINANFDKNQYNELGNQFFKKFVKSMLVLEHHATVARPIIFRTLNFLNPYEMLEFCKSINIPTYNKK